MLCGGWAGAGVPWNQVPTGKAVIGGEVEELQGVKEIGG